MSLPTFSKNNKFSESPKNQINRNTGIQRCNKRNACRTTFAEESASCPNNNFIPQTEKSLILCDAKMLKNWVVHFLPAWK